MLSTKRVDARIMERLSPTEQRALQRAEITITKGMRAFIAVGLALTEIRNRRLYRDKYGTFEEYCARRWDISRTRGYEISAAAQVVQELSANADIRLPENEAQVRPLTRLDSPVERQRAWRLVVKTASAQDRPITARDTVEAVRSLKVNGRTRGFRGLALASTAAANGSAVAFEVHCGHTIELAPTLTVATPVTPYAGPCP